MFSLHSSSFNFHAIFISLTPPVLLIGEQYKYIPECKLLLSSFKPSNTVHLLVQKSDILLCKKYLTVKKVMHALFMITGINTY